MRISYEQVVTGAIIARNQNRARKHIEDQYEGLWRSIHDKDELFHDDYTRFLGRAGHLLAGNMFPVSAVTYIYCLIILLL